MNQKDWSPKHFRFFRNSFFLMLISLFLIQPMHGIPGGQDAGKPKSDSLKQKVNLFDSDELLDVSLSFDLTTFQKKSDKAGSYDATMIFRPGQMDSVSVKATVKHRGEYRFQTCSFPPIQLVFRKSVYTAADTGKIKKIKLVTHCTPGNASDDYVLREYLVYKIYSVITDTSYRVRLLRITYNDTGKKRKPVTQFGFFIEPNSVLAARLNSTELKAENLNQGHIIPGVMDKVALFNYMIANWDWSVPGLHNITVLKSKIVSLSGLGIAIPYDFDLCGVVNADYGVPAPEMGLTSSRDRRFAGVCRDKQIFQTELKQYSEKKEKIYSVINDFPHLNQRSKKDITTFLDQFFDQLEKQREIDYLISNFLGNCKKL
jgi:hypothetical protein